MNAPSKTPLVAFLIILAGLGYFVVRIFAPYALALFLGATLAALAYPAYGALLARGAGRRLSAVLVSLGILLLVITPAALFTSQAVGQAIRLGQDLSEREALSLEILLDRLQQLPVLGEWLGDPEALRQQSAQLVRKSAGQITATVVALAREVPRLLLQLLLTVVALYFFLVDGRRFVEWALDRSGLDPDVRQRLVKSLHGTAIATVWASLAASSSQALIVFLGYLILGLPAAFLAGGAAFILAWIPMVGTLPVTLTGVIVLYAQGAGLRMAGMIVVMAAAGLIDNIVRPLVLRGGEGMHPFVALLSILGGISFFGLFGVFIGPILTAMFISLFDVWPALVHRSRGS